MSECASYYSVQLQDFQLLPGRHQGNIWLRVEHFIINGVLFLQSLFVLGPQSCQFFLALAEGKHRLSQCHARKYDGRQKWRLQRSDKEPSWPKHLSGNCQLKNAVTSLWMCGGAGMLSLHCWYMVALECYHFTVDMWWRWNVVISL